MRDIRISIAIITTILFCTGVIMIFSSSGIYSLQERGDSTYFLKRHLLFLAIGFVFMLCAMAIDYRWLQKYAKPLLVLAIFLLVMVLMPGLGKESYGAQRWFRLGGFHFQPSEFAKLAMIIYLADFLSRKQNKIAGFKEGFLPLMMILGVVCLLILKQPDMGTSVYLALITLIMLFIAGTKIQYLTAVFLMSLPLFYFLVMSKPYRMARIMAFLDPWQDSQGIGFQLSQSQIALGSGGLFGVGLGKSMQKLFYLPAAHTDFILSIIGEELGLLGTYAVIILFGLFLWQGARIAKRISHPFGYYLSIGIILMIGLQAVINIGVSIGALPTKGLPLPFVSYGGSALIFNMIAVGLLLNISRVEDL